VPEDSPGFAELARDALIKRWPYISTSRQVEMGVVCTTCPLDIRRELEESYRGIQGNLADAREVASDGALYINRALNDLVVVPPGNMAQRRYLHMKVCDEVFWQLSNGIIMAYFEEERPSHARISPLVRLCRMSDDAEWNDVADSIQHMIAVMILHRDIIRAGTREEAPLAAARICGTCSKPCAPSHLAYKPRHGRSACDACVRMTGKELHGKDAARRCSRKRGRKYNLPLIVDH